MRRRHADPADLMHSSKLVAAWKRRVAERAAGNELADEHWYRVLLAMARPVPPPTCSACDDSGIVLHACTVDARCNGRMCEHRDRRNDFHWTHTYARACACDGGTAFRGSFALAQRPEYARPKGPAHTTSYGFKKATEAQR